MYFSVRAMYEFEELQPWQKHGNTVQHRAVVSHERDLSVVPPTNDMYLCLHKQVLSELLAQCASQFRQPIVAELGWGKQSVSSCSPPWPETKHHVVRCKDWFILHIPGNELMWWQCTLIARDCALSVEALDCYKVEKVPPIFSFISGGWLMICIHFVM